MASETHELYSPVRVCVCVPLHCRLSFVHGSEWYTQNRHRSQVCPLVVNSVVGHCLGDFYAAAYITDGGALPPAQSAFISSIAHLFLRGKTYIPMSVKCNQRAHNIHQSMRKTSSNNNNNKKWTRWRRTLKTDSGNTKTTTKYIAQHRLQYLFVVVVHVVLCVSYNYLAAHIRGWCWNLIKVPAYKLYIWSADLCMSLIFYFFGCVFFFCSFAWFCVRGALCALSFLFLCALCARVWHVCDGHAWNELGRQSYC